MDTLFRRYEWIVQNILEFEIFDATPLFDTSMAG